MKRSTTKPAFETLEDRCVPTTATLTNGILTVYGTSASETIQIKQAAGKVTVVGVRSFAAGSVKGVYLDAGDGNDRVDLRTLGVGATVRGGIGNDFLVGTKASDYLYGDDGNDNLFGMGGNDVLMGGYGNDRLFGMGGYDYLYGEGDNDFLDDGLRTGQEFADGGAGSDWNADVVAVNGTAGTDIIQRGAPTCGFLSVLSGLARNGTDFTRWVRYANFTGAGMPQYDVAFWRNGAWNWNRVNFDGTLNSLDTSSAAEGESWTIIMQRAWIKWHGNEGRTWPHEAIFALTGKNASAKYSVASGDFNRIANALANNQLVISATVASPSSLLVGNHAYTVVQTWGSGSNAWVQVRNPWGVDGGATASGDASDALVWLTWAEFQANMNYLAIA